MTNNLITLLIVISTRLLFKKLAAKIMIKLKLSYLLQDIN